MKKDWEPGGLLLTAWVQVRIAITACDPQDIRTRPIMSKALQTAHIALDTARLQAIKEEIECLNPGL